MGSEDRGSNQAGLALPFLSALGYNVFDPNEIVPEFTADIGSRKGEKVDYAIIKEGEPVIVIECKRMGDALGAKAATQLQRYFHALQTARVAVYTDGLTYKFFGDLDTDNLMDEAPFLEVNITNLSGRDIDELSHFAKDSFDVDTVRDNASMMKHLREMKEYLAKSLSSPGEEFVRFLAGRVYSGRITQQRFEYFQPLVAQAFTGFISDRIAATIQRAQDLQDAPDLNDMDEDDPVDEGPDDGIITTEDELAAFEVVKAIVGEVVDASRAFFRDFRSYSTVYFDNNNRKPICRFRFNKRPYQIGIPDADKVWTRYPVDQIDDIQNYGEKIRDVVRRYVDGLQEGNTERDPEQGD